MTGQDFGALVRRAAAVPTDRRHFLGRAAGLGLALPVLGGLASRMAVAQEPTVTIGHTFLRALETGDRSALRQDYDDAARSLEVCLAANESAATGAVIRFDDAGNRRPA